MAAYATTKLSSKGQVVIPEGVRARLGLRAGDQFVVIGQGDTVIFKSITPPSTDELKKLLGVARREAKKAALRPAQVKQAIRRARKHAP
jgi:AbrB family looped-hinge helix DNA binding protein